MKIYFIFLCLFISGALASATTQTTANQDKPPHVYVESYNMNDQASGSYLFEDNGGPYAGYSENQSLTYNANFNGVINGTNGLIGAGTSAVQAQEADSDGGSATLNENWVEATTNFVPNLIVTDTDSWGDDATDDFGNESFPIFQEHCDINGPSFVSASDGYEYESWSVTHRRGAQAILKLQTGGKATSKLRNVFGLTGSAVQIIPVSFSAYNGWLSESAWNYWHNQTSGTNIPSQNITIGSYGNLNSSGVLYKILPDNANVVVTPSVANVDYYDFNVSATKYHSYFEVFDEQANPGYSFLPFGTNEVGHAFWQFSTEAPSDAMQYISTNLTRYLGISCGFFPSNGLFTLPGQMEFGGANGSANIHRKFYIGFNNLIDGLEFTKDTTLAPPVYTLTSFNCVGAARGAGFAADIFGLPWDESPQNFGVTLIQMYPPILSSDPFDDEVDIFYSSAPY